MQGHIGKHINSYQILLTSSESMYADHGYLKWSFTGTPTDEAISD